MMSGVPLFWSDVRALPLPHLIFFSTISAHKLKLKYSVSLQLAQLFEEARNGTRHLGEVLVSHNPDLIGWWHNQLQKHKGDALLLQKVVGSPVVDGYRNKYDFKIGMINL